MNLINFLINFTAGDHRDHKLYSVKTQKIQSGRLIPVAIVFGLQLDSIYGSNMKKRLEKTNLYLSEFSLRDRVYCEKNKCRIAINHRKTN